MGGTISFGISFPKTVVKNSFSSLSLICYCPFEAVTTVSVLKCEFYDLCNKEFPKLRWLLRLQLKTHQRKHNKINQTKLLFGGTKLGRK